MPRLRGIIKAAVVPMPPRRCKEVIIDRAVRRLPRLSFPPPGLRQFNRTGIQKPPLSPDPWIATDRS